MKNFQKLFHIATFAALITGVIYFSGVSSLLYRASVISYPEHEPFDGTVYPIKKVANWVDSSNWDKSYSSFSSSELVALPYYDPDVLTTPVENLEWGNSEHDKIRNAKITYSVPYMGNYLLDGRENGGSHPAVDIKTPEGTPVYSMANGTVIEVSNLSSGFGKYVVIRHKNFPTLSNSNARELLYSSYSHLGSILVNEGDVVDKGEQIALSGSSGTATTPHLHFQIDNDDASWHPFWPFTSSEAYNAGLDFFSAVNAGLGRDRALSVTVNPMKYVQKYSDGNYSESYVNVPEPEEEEPEEVVEPETPEVAPEEPEETPNVTVVEEEPEEPVVPVVEVESTPAEPEPKFQIEVDGKYYIGQNSDFSIVFKDEAGSFDGTAKVVSDRGNFTASTSLINTFSFDSSEVASNSFKNLDEGRDRVKVEYDGETYYSAWFDIEDPRSGGTVFADVDPTGKYSEAIASLAAKGVITGYPDGSFRPDQTVSRVEALKFIFASMNDVDLRKGTLPFFDTKKDQWYYEYVYTAYKDKVVNGYDDGSFKPANVVNRVEFLKMLFVAMDVKVKESVDKSPFKDVPAKAWFAPYVEKALKMEIIDGGDKFGPNDGMSRAEVAEVIYRVVD